MATLNCVIMAKCDELEFSQIFQDKQIDIPIQGQWLWDETVYLNEQTSNLRAFYC